MHDAVPCAAKSENRCDSTHRLAILNAMQLTCLCIRTYVQRGEKQAAHYIVDPVTWCNGIGVATVMHANPSGHEAVKYVLC